MAQLTWQTLAGSLGVIPEGVFYRQNLLATAPYQIIPANCTQTSAATNLITCDTTLDVVPGLTVRFFGIPFGGLAENTNYYVFSVPSLTTFTVATALDASEPLALTNGAGVMTARFGSPIFYRLQSGTLPQGVQLATNGTVIGVPTPVARVQGVPVEVSRDVISKFTIRAFTQRTVNGVAVVDSIADRTFTLTVTGNDVPDFITPAGNIGTYYDGDQVELQIQYTDTDPDDATLVRLIGGSLPLGLRITATGRIFGYIRPFPDVNKPPGYDLTAVATEPYDFISAAISKNYQFTLEITDGKSSNLRTFEIFVYNRADLTADDTYITADTTFVTADQTPERAPFLLNAETTNIGTIRSENNFAYRFIGEDYDSKKLEYAISVNEGVGLPPGLTLDPYSGWYYGTIPDVGITETTYSFFVQVRSRSLACTSTQSGTNIIVCDATTRGDFYVGAEVRFEGTSIGGISIDEPYYVVNIISDTEFQISASFAGPVFNLTTDTIGPNEYLLCVPRDISASQLYPFTLTVVGDIDREVTWLTDSDLGFIENGAVSTLRVRAVNRGGTPLLYQLASGSFNELPQGLQLLPSGEISGRVTFNTFSIDLGATTFDASQDTVTRIETTTFDSTFVFTVNAFAEDTQQELFKVSAVRVINGGTGYSSAPSIIFDATIGAEAIRATATVAVQGGSIQSVTVTNSGAGYTAPATFTLTGVGSDAVLQVVMQPTGVRRVISVFKTFTVRVLRVYNKPYQNLYIVAMPPQNNRSLLESLLENTDIFVPEYIYRPDDPYFGVSKRVQYEHAVGLAPDTLETYVESLNLNHYWKNLVLGPLRTARAVNIQGEVVYEVVYCEVVDDLVNQQGQSVSKVVTLPYAIPNPTNPAQLINSVYPNSLINMRDQVIDVVGQISRKLPLWMTSKQDNGSVLGFRPAWVICYTNPGRSEQIAYYIETQFGQRFNLIDFKVDRYVLDSSMSRNWDPATQNWTPDPSLTTFDRINTAGFTDLGVVNACTELAFTDVNGRALVDINALGGLDGPTWVQVAGQSPPQGTRVIIREGSQIIFVKQEGVERYPDVNQAFIQNITWYDEDGFDDAGSSVAPGSYDYGVVIPSGTETVCSSTNSGSDLITSISTRGMFVGNKIWFTGSVFGGLSAATGSGFTQLYYVHSVRSITGTATTAGSNSITVNSVSGLQVDDEIWFPNTTIGGIVSLFNDGSYRPYFVLSIVGNQIQIGTTPGGTPVTVTTATGNMTIALNQFSVSTSPSATEPTALTTASGTMTANFNNDRMAIYTIHILDGDVLELELGTQTITNDYITSSQGAKYNAGTLLFRPIEPAGMLTRVNWQPLIAATTVVISETTFDQGSLQFVEPVDMYDPTDEFDKYLVFPKTNILV